MMGKLKRKVSCQVGIIKISLLSPALSEFAVEKGSIPIVQFWLNLGNFPVLPMMGAPPFLGVMVSA